MGDSRSTSKFQLQSPVVDYIDNRLPKHHPAFQTPQAKYSFAHNRFVITHTDEAMQIASNSWFTPPRPAALDVNAMPFWNEIFPDAMTQFQKQSTETKGRLDSGYSIRNAKGWDDAKSILENARESYSKETGFRGWVRKTRRRAADNIQPVEQSLRMVPNTHYVSAVVNVLQFVLEAAQTAAKVRQGILSGFDDLEDTFSDIDLFLGTFPKDTNIREAAVKLIANILEAVEQVIGFYIKHTWAKMGSAVFKGDDYQDHILECLTNIKSCSEYLIHQAQNSHIYTTSHAMNEVLRISTELRRTQQESSKRQRRLESDVHRVKDGVWQIQDGVVRVEDGLNSIHDLLDDHFKQYQRDRKAYIDELRRQQAELDAVKEKNTNLNLEIGVLRATTPQPTIYAGIGSSSGEWYISPESLWSMLDIPGFDLQDMEYIDGIRERLPTSDRARTEKLVRTQKFRDWVVSPTSTKLLILGDFHGTSYISPLSLLCSALTQSLRQRSQFISLVFFCGRHIDEDDIYFGGRAMIKSFIAQLLSQQFFDTGALHHEINLGAIQNGGLRDLLLLFQWLMRRLPVSTTVFCLIDGIGYYEREEAKGDLFPVLEYLLKITTDRTIAAAAKVLLLSPSATLEVREFFADDTILSMVAMPRTGGYPSKWRLERELNDGLEES